MSVINDAPWSAAFVVWVVNEAAKRTSGLTFPTGPSFAAHVSYANAIRQGGFPWDVLSPSTSETSFSPRELEPGDIIIQNRAGNTQTFYQWQPTSGWRGFSHGDIVVRDRIGEGGVAIGGNLGDKVSEVTYRDLRNFFVILRAKSRQHRVHIRDVAREELERWKQNGWTSENQQGARERVALYWSAVGYPYIPSLDFRQTSISQTTKLTPTPAIASLDSFHPKIQYELTRRRTATETANVYMPFVKLTSLSRVLPDNLIEGGTAYCPSLGIHGENAVTYDDIYQPQTNKSIIGYAITDDGRKNVPVVVANETQDARNIPIPGITQLTADRGTAGPMGVRGGLFKADMKIVAYSVGQVDALLRYFLRPATRVVLELGRKSSNQQHENEKITPFNWKQKESEISDYFSQLIKSPEKQQEFIKKYIYDNYGNYEVYIAYVVKFNLKYNKNNVFEIDLTLHSVQQVEIPTKHTGVQATCPNPTDVCKAMDILEYFDSSYSWKDNSFSKLMSLYDTDQSNETLSQEDLLWRQQVISITNSNSNSIGANSTNAGTREKEYFVTWNFFVEKILNDTTYGIASLFGSTESARDIANLALLRPTVEPLDAFDNGLIANQVGYHPNLRSTNPSVMVIYNEIAQTAFRNSTDYNTYEDILDIIKSESKETSSTVLDNTLQNKIKNQSISFSANIETPQKAGASFLTRGIWINTAAIKQAFTSTDTISSAINVLLTMMNGATEGYWNLQLYTTDVNVPGMHVIDMGLSKLPKLASGTSLKIDYEEAETTNILDSINGITEQRYQGATKDEPKYIYMFNRGTKVFQDGDLGSDIIDLNVEFNLPQVVAVQAIANIGGPAQKSTLQSINVKELQDITLIKNLYTPCNDTDICAPESPCRTDSIRQLTKAVEDARRELAALQEAERRRPLSTDVQFVASAARINSAQLKLTNAEAELRKVSVTQRNPNLIGAVRQYADLGTLLEYVEINPSRMMKLLNLDSTNAERNLRQPPVHAFNSSNLTKTIVDVTLPGIGGIGLFQSFLVDRVPSILDRGFYVVTKVTHEFSTQSGWITKIQGRFRFKPSQENTTGDTVCPPQPLRNIPADTESFV